MEIKEIPKPTSDAELEAALLSRIKNDPGAIIATIIRPYKRYLGEQTLRTRIYRLEKEGLITIQRQFGRAYVFPVSSD